VGPQDDDDPVEHYLSVVADKTGSLIATSGRFGALLSGADERVVDVLTRFGERIGVAFQLSDDILDVASESSDSGKTPGTDLREGVATLPSCTRDAAPTRRSPTTPGSSGSSTATSPTTTRTARR
jgi:heptaprenyl diphosphate synthase